MQRAEQLRPLSRQHHLGLNLGLKAGQFPMSSSEADIQDQWQKITAFIRDELTVHFGVEEEYLVKPLMTYHKDNPQVIELSEQLTAQHEELKRLADKANPTIEDLRDLGDALYEHIRFEEREVFPLAQELLTSEQLDAIYTQSGDDVK